MNRLLKLFVITFLSCLLVRMTLGLFHTAFQIGTAVVVLLCIAVGCDYIRGKLQ